MDKQEFITAVENLPYRKVLPRTYRSIRYKVEGHCLCPISAVYYHQTKFIIPSTSVALAGFMLEMDKDLFASIIDAADSTSSLMKFLDKIS